MTTHFVDSSAWISYFRPGAGKWDARIDALLEDDGIAINGIVRSELLIGTRSEKEYEQLAQSLEGLHWLQTDQSFFDRVARNGCILRRKGITVPLADLVIATHCIVHGLVLIHDDQHFPAIAGVLALQLEQV